MRGYCLRIRKIEFRCLGEGEALEQYRPCMASGRFPRVERAAPHLLYEETKDIEVNIQETLCFRDARAKP